MNKSTSPLRIHQHSLEAGQLWHMAEANLQVVAVGKLLVHYKLGKPDARRVPNSCTCIKTIQKYLGTGLLSHFDVVTINEPAEQLVMERFANPRPSNRR